MNTDAAGSSGSVMRGVVHLLKMVVILAVLGFLGLVIYRYPIVVEKQKSDAMVERIRAARLTREDVDGSKLPPTPDPKLVDATVEGVDTNANGIRDDVELAIFKKYPGAANLKLRAAELQYAKALQMYLTNVFSVDTLTAVSWQDSRAYFCISELHPGKPGVSAPESAWQFFDSNLKASRVFVEGAVFNTAERQQRKEKVFDSYMSSHADPNSGYCDIV